MIATPSTFVVVERESRLADPVPDMRIVRVGPDDVRRKPSVIPSTRSVVMVAAEAVEEMLARRKNIRFLYHIGDEFSGFDAKAMWDDAKVGLKHFSAWERVAVVTEVGWIRTAMKAFGFVMPGRVRVFGNSELAEARQWLSE